MTPGVISVEVRTRKSHPVSFPRYNLVLASSRKRER
jgi:hypothetical protein